MPSSDGCVLLLDRMNRILDFDDQLAYITVEPGVTFAQVQQFLAERHAALCCDRAGTANASLIGNALERGISSRAEQRSCARNVHDLVVVLPDSNCLYTGAGNLAGGSGRVWPHGLTGPALDGLFYNQIWAWWRRRPLARAPEAQLYAARLLFCDQRARAALSTSRPAADHQARAPAESSVGLFNAFQVLGYAALTAGLPQTQAVDLGDLPYARVLRGGEWFGETMITAPNDEIGDDAAPAVAQQRAVVDRSVFIHLMRQTRCWARLCQMWQACTGASAHRRQPTPDPDRDRCG